MSRNSSTTAPLCLACSSSLPPRLWKRTQQGIQSGHASSSGGRDSELLFLTRCCGRPICPSCLTANPRLARYNPCLACLGGVGAVGTEKRHGQHLVASNVDGAVRDEDVFVVGDEDDDEDASGTTRIYDGEATTTPGIVSSPSEGPGPQQLGIRVGPCADPDKRDDPTDKGTAGRYYIRPDDTLLGISLRLGIDGRTLCKLNDLPPSTLRTTPHLLHTRTFLVLPQSHSHVTSDVAPEEEAQHTRARAQVAFQQVTKEMDDGIAQAYVALAEDSGSEPDVATFKVEGEKKESSPSRRVARMRIALAERALDRYLDDDEWERRERAEGRGVHIQRLSIGRGQYGEKVGWWGW